MLTLSIKMRFNSQPVVIILYSHSQSRQNEKRTTSQDTLRGRAPAEWEINKA
jgi:hypothetical protein